MKNTSIQWTDLTWNPWRGCRKVAPECDNCYITTTVPFRMIGQKHGKDRYRASEAVLAAPLQWSRRAMKTGERPKVFCLSLGDWLDNEVPIEWLEHLVRMIDDTPNLTWQLLTKRPQNFVSRMEQIRHLHCANQWLNGKPPENVWIGVSAGADQRAALDIPAKVHFLSCEPMLKPIRFASWLPTQQFNWIIFGGESGNKARTCRINWIREGVKFCKNHGIACFVKQLGKNSLDPTGHPMMLKDSHGADWDEWPEDLRVREFPKI